MEKVKNKILFDGSATQGTKNTPFHGGGEYAKFVLKEALKQGYLFDIFFKENRITDPHIIELLRQYPECVIYNFSSNQEIYKLIQEKRYKRFFSALPYSFMDYSIPETLFIQVIHGLRSIELPWDEYRYKYYKKIYMRAVARIISSCKFIQKKLKAKHISETLKALSIPNSLFFTVSEHSKYALLNFYPFLKEEDIKVFYSPFELSPFELSENRSEKYYLMVNANRYEKNAFRTIQAFDKLITDGRLKDSKIIITGYANYPFFKQIKNQSYFRLLPYVEKEEIENLYKNAFVFVYPSLNEGFGYPPLKAMGYGVPVIASACTSISEICGNAALYFNPLSVDEICNRILQIEYNEYLRRELIAKGDIHVRALLEKQESELKIMLKLIFDDEMV